MKNFATMFLAALAAVAVALFAYEKINEGTRQEYVHAANLAQGLATASQMRVAVNIYWQENGKLPCTNDDLGFPESSMHANSIVSTLALTACGEISAIYTEASGVDGGALVFRAREVLEPMGGNLAWDCVTRDYRGIEKLIPQCRYDPELGREAPPPQTSVSPDDAVSPAPVVGDRPPRDGYEFVSGTRSEQLK